MDRPLHILALGAHPDDADIKAGGTAAQWCALGHRVLLVSLTDGAAGHHRTWGPPLAARRRAEAQAAAAVIGATYEVWDYPDGELMATLEARRRVLRLLRTFRPDVVLTHRTGDYHPDHFATAQLVAEASYMTTVPAACPEAPHLEQSPVILYFADSFTRPCRFEPHIVVPAEDVFDKVVSMLHCHVSQFYEWLPYNAGRPDEVPTDDGARRAWLAEMLRRRNRPLAERCGGTGYVEAFEVSEYGAPFDAATRARLFPWLSPVDASAVNARKEWVDMPSAS